MRRFKDGYNYFGRYPEKVLAFIPTLKVAWLSYMS
jgi:hypothetical protein